MNQELYNEIRECEMDQDKILNELNPVYHALDTYETLRKHMSENEALKLTEIICRNEWDKQKCSSLDYLSNIIDELKFN